MYHAVYVHFHAHTHTTAYLAGGLAGKARWITTESWEKKLEQPGFISSPVCHKLLSDLRNSPVQSDASLLTSDKLSSQTHSHCSLSSTVLAWRRVTHLSPVSPHLRAQRPQRLSGRCGNPPNTLASHRCFDTTVADETSFRPARLLRLGHRRCTVLLHAPLNDWQAGSYREAACGEAGFRLESADSDKLP